MKKFRITGIIENGDSWTHRSFDRVVEGESAEAVREEFQGYDASYNYWDIETVEEVEE